MTRLLLVFLFSSFCCGCASILNSSHTKIKVYTTYGTNIWDLSYYDNFDAPPPSRIPIKLSHKSVGIVFPFHYQAGKRLNLGLIYRPTFFRLNKIPAIRYEHLVSLDFAWKIGLR